MMRLHGLSSSEARTESHSNTEDILVVVCKPICVALDD